MGVKGKGGIDLRLIEAPILSVPPSRNRGRGKEKGLIAGRYGGLESAYHVFRLRGKGKEIRNPSKLRTI